MSLLPGVPNMGPAPVSPTIATPGKSAMGGPSGIAKIAQGVGKPGNTEHLGSIIGRTGKGMTSLGGGNSGAHSFSQYAKQPAAGALMGGELAGSSNGVNPTAHPGAKMIRGGGGGMRSHIRQGGLGAGDMGMPAPDNSSGMASGDTE